jgi:ketosteroid isomerase-like protein
MGPRERREALLEAVNAHDLEAIKSFVDPSYLARNELGMVLADYRAMLSFAERLFRKHPEYCETLDVEEIDEQGDSVLLTTRRTETYRGILGRERSRQARQVETWEYLEGRWMIVEERCLTSEDERGIVPWWSWTS